MKRSMTVALAMLAGMGCQRSSSEDDAGVVRMALVASAGGSTYRLHGARFVVAGPSTVTLDSETQPDAETLATTLAAGAYTIDLLTGWELQRLDGGVYQPVQATLISQNPVGFSIAAGAITNLAYQFSSSGGVITVGSGTLTIGLQVFADGGPPTGPPPGPDAGACVNLTVKNPMGWCSVSIAGGPTSTAAMQTICVAPGDIAAIATPSSSGFSLGAAPWHHTVGDTGSGDPGTIATNASTATIHVSTTSTCAWVCCPFVGGQGCPTSDACP